MDHPPADNQGAARQPRTFEPHVLARFPGQDREADSEFGPLARALAAGFDRAAVPLDQAADQRRTMAGVAAQFPADTPGAARSRGQ